MKGGDGKHQSKGKSKQTQNPIVPKTYCGSSGLIRHESQLAKAVARCQFGDRVVTVSAVVEDRHGDGAGEDDEELVAKLALLEHDTVAGHLGII